MLSKIKYKKVHYQFFSWIKDRKNIVDKRHDTYQINDKENVYLEIRENSVLHHNKSV